VYQAFLSPSLVILFVSLIHEFWNSSSFNYPSRYRLLTFGIRFNDFRPPYFLFAPQFSSRFPWVGIQISILVFPNLTTGILSIEIHGCVGERDLSWPTYPGISVRVVLVTSRSIDRVATESGREHEFLIPWWMGALARNSNSAA
jgi:hypothetical protein